MTFVLKVKVNEGKQLPIMNETSQLCDSYIEIRFKNDCYKTSVCWSTLNPNWNSETFEFEIETCDAYTEHLVLKIMDHDNYSADNVIGRIYISLIPLLGIENERMLSGWLPIFDSVFGIRGSINVSVALISINILSLNKLILPVKDFIPFFSLCGVPSGYKLLRIDGFVSDFTCNDDPEQQWIDLVRSQRTSNDVRQRVLSKLSNELQYKIYLQAKSYGSNAILGYKQYLDLEKEYGLYFRGIGTCVTIEKISDSIADLLTQDQPNSLTARFNQTLTSEPPLRGLSIASSAFEKEETDRDRIDSNFSGNSDVEEEESITSSEIPLDSIPIITMSFFPASSLSYIGNIVASYSVHALSKHEDECDLQETRECWWKEIRQEVRFHARSFGCSAVIGYTENEVIVEDFAILTGFGTAVIFNEDICPFDDSGSKKCYLVHIPESINVFGYKNKCNYCNRGMVSSCLLSNIPLPYELPYIGSSSYIHAEVIRTMKSNKTNDSMEMIYSMLPFMESEIMSKLIKKLKLRGMNAIFDIETQISINDDIVVFTRSGTAYRLSPLPAPNLPKISSSDKQFKEFTHEYSNNIMNIYNSKNSTTPHESSVNAPNMNTSTPIHEEFENLYESTTTTAINYIDMDKSEINSLFDPFPVKNCSLQTTIYPTINKYFHLENTNTINFISTFPILSDEGIITSDFTGYFNKFLTFCSLHAISLYPNALVNININFDLSEENYLSFITTCTVSNHSDRISPQETKQNDNGEINFFRQGSIENDISEKSYESSSQVRLYNMDHLSLSENTEMEYAGYLNYCFIKETFIFRADWITFCPFFWKNLFLYSNLMRKH